MRVRTVIVHPQRMSYFMHANLSQRFFLQPFFIARQDCDVRLIDVIRAGCNGSPTGV